MVYHRSFPPPTFGGAIMSHMCLFTFSIMLCCSAGGKFLPPMVVNKSMSENEEWKVGGPTGLTKYLLKTVPSE